MRYGCTFKGYRYFNAGELMFTINDDEQYLENYDNAISSYSCHCSPSKMMQCIELGQINWLIELSVGNRLRCSKN